MTASKEGKWVKGVNFDNAKLPLSNMLKALKEIEKDYKKKKEDLIRIKKGQK